MALSRRMGRREDPPIWSGFVDALTTLLLVLMFVLTIFTVVQSVLRETIDTQGSELDALSAQVEGLADALGLERQRAEGLEGEVGRLTGALDRATAEGAAQSALVATLRGTLTAREADLAAAQSAIDGFEAQVASLLAERDGARDDAARLTASLAEVEAARADLLSRQDALNLALAAARSEIDAQTEAARLAAAQREALDALVADLRTEVEGGKATLAETLARLQAAEGQSAALTAQVADLTADLSRTEAARLAEAAAAGELRTQLTEAEKARLADLAAADALRARLTEAEGALTEAEKTRLADLAAAEALRARLKSADDELTAMTLSLEAERKRAEETLTLLAAAEDRAGEAANSAQVRAGLLEAARKVLTEKDQALIDGARKTALLNQQVIELRAQLGALQTLLDAAEARDAAASVRVETLGSQLNAALAQVASEERRRAALEEAERKRIEAEKLDLERYRSEFFGQLSALLQGREGVRIVGDRFVFSSEVLFTAGSADLVPEGQAQIAGVVATLNEIAAEIPPQIDWIIRVDGHTDDVPLSGAGAFRDNWELSQARALSVVRFMQDDLGFDPRRMAATGFGEWRPVALGDSDFARAQNRRIELKLTER